jgi:hypothetical protein
MKTEKEILEGLAECEAEVREAVRELYTAVNTGDWDEAADKIGFVFVGLSAIITVNEMLKS